MKKIFILFCTVCILGACSDFLQEYSQDLAKVESLSDLDEILLGKGYLPVGRFDYTDYGSIMPVSISFQAAHYMSDELTMYKASGTGDNFGLRSQMFGWYTWQQSVGLLYEGNSRNRENTDWERAYQCINICNMVLVSANELPANNAVQQLQKNRIQGEAHFLRALYYFTLGNLYGQPYCAQTLATPGVPLKLSEYVEDKDYVTNTVEEVYAQVVADLDKADVYLTDNEVKNHPYRADIVAVWLLKSRVYLYMQHWTKALEYAKKVLERKNELLDLNTHTFGKDVLSKTSPETIFSMGGHVIANSTYNYKAAGYGNYPVYTISNTLKEAFSEGENDWRTMYYIMEDEMGGPYTDYIYTREWVLNKVKGWEFGPKETSDNFLFRTAEAYLNAAEAAAYLEDEATARTMLQALRDKRLKESRKLTESGKELVDLIRRERQCELCLESHRWFDLRRYMVCEKFPESKKITHHYTKFSSDWMSLGKPIETKEYVLEENDAAYTLSLPKEVLDFQNTLQSNQRPPRPGKLVVAE